MRAVPRLSADSQCNAQCACRALRVLKDAADCCLHTHPTMTAFGRQRVAAAVASGASWIEAVTANVQH